MNSVASAPSSAASAISSLSHLVGSAPVSPQPATLSAWESAGHLFANAATSIPGSLAGAFFGALGAYSVQRLVAKRQERKSAELAAHRTLFSLFQQMNTVVLIQRDYIAGHETNPARFLSIPASMPFDPERDALDLSDLAYLFDKPESRRILYALYNAQEHYKEALRMWNERSDLHQGEALTKFAAAGLESGTEISLEDLKKALGTPTLGTLVTGTENCIRLLKTSFQMLGESKADLRSYVVKRFGHSDFADFNVDEKFGLDLPYVKHELFYDPNPTV